MYKGTVGILGGMVVGGSSPTAAVSPSSCRAVVVAVAVVVAGIVRGGKAVNVVGNNMVSGRDVVVVFGRRGGG